MINKQKLPLIIGLSIPVILVLVLTAIVYIPSLFSNPKYNFVYSSGGYYYQEYEVIMNKLTKRQLPDNDLEFRKYYPDPKLFVHDVKTNSSSEVSFAEAQKLTLDSNNISTDGYEVVRGGGSGDFFPFFYGGSDYNSWYLKGHGSSKKLKLQTGSSYYGVQFLGWIK